MSDGARPDVEPSPQLMRAAARLRVAADEVRGYETPEWIKELAKPDERELALTSAKRKQLSWWRRLMRTG